MGSVISKLGLGTAQWGMDYGISNPDGQTSREEVRSILELAGRSGIRCLDTASLYGTSEQVLGETMPAGHDFKIITKTPVFHGKNISNKEVRELESSFDRSLARLGEDRVHALMIHHVRDLLAPGGKMLFEAMKAFKESGKVCKIGVSVYSGPEIDDVINSHDIDIIQVPVNVLDQRLIDSGHLRELKRLGVEVHVRSIFLQGLLLMDPKSLPAYFRQIKGHLEKFQEECRIRKTTRIRACLDFVLGLAEADMALVGVCSRQELLEILNQACQDRVLMDYSKYALHDEEMLNPAFWKMKSEVRNP